MEVQRRRACATLSHCDPTAANRSTSTSPTKLFCSVGAPKRTPAPPRRCPSPQQGRGALGDGGGGGCLCAPPLMQLQLWDARITMEILQNPSVGDGSRCLIPHALISSPAAADALGTQVPFQAFLSPVNPPLAPALQASPS